MSETLYTLTATHGVGIVVICAYLSCLAIPIPTSLVMLAAGAFCAAGDLDFGTVLASAWIAAALGDQTGYWIGRRYGPGILDRIARNPSRTRLIERAREVVAERGGVGVFFSTWLFSPLGPWVNLAAGSAGLGWLRFSIADLAGEAIWVTFYLSMGYIFAQRLDQLAALLSQLSGFLAAGAVTLLLGWLLRYRLSRASDTP